MKATALDVIARSYWLPVPQQEALYPNAHAPMELIRRLAYVESAEAKKLYAEYFRD